MDAQEKESTTMEYVRIGNLVINLSLVKMVQDHPGEDGSASSATVHFAGDTQPTQFYEDEGRAIGNWVLDKAKDISKGPPSRKMVTHTRQR